MLFLCRRLSLLCRPATLISLADDLVFQVVLRARRWLIGPWRRPPPANPRRAPAVSLRARRPVATAFRPSSAAAPPDKRTPSTSIDTLDAVRPRAHPLGVDHRISEQSPADGPRPGLTGRMLTSAHAKFMSAALLCTSSFATHFKWPSWQGIPRLPAAAIFYPWPAFPFHNLMLNRHAAPRHPSHSHHRCPDWLFQHDAPCPSLTAWFISEA
ncbi:hypothetical protein B0J12DRAFT_75365 [Macrophomina phaseolina]|uniref:Uncharacterized protein n=1 Tax=Macrophomina phaseolina TaxID=35725 RepID=A0ABQ8GDV2_9PEZI|nr:hypothetical protein B0J12DRAFT_75365 [Macrophomina phaseolina]